MYFRSNLIKFCKPKINLFFNYFSDNNNRMQNPNRLTSMKINRGNRSFARSRGSSSPKQHYHRHHHPHRRNHHHNGLFITTTLLSCKASSSSVTFVLCCLYLMSCCWLQPIVASSGQKVSTI